MISIIFKIYSNLIYKGLSFNILSKTVPLPKSLRSEFAASLSKQALFNLFLWVWFRLPVISKFLNSLMMFSKWSTSAISKARLSEMQLVHKFVSSQEKFVHNFIGFKLTVSNIIKIKYHQLMEYYLMELDT